MDTWFAAFERSTPTTSVTTYMNSWALHRVPLLLQFSWQVLDSSASVFLVHDARQFCPPKLANPRQRTCLLFLVYGGPSLIIVVSREVSVHSVVCHVAVLCVKFIGRVARKGVDDSRWLASLFLLFPLFFPSFTTPTR